MKNWFQKLLHAMNRFMYGRYGTDELSMVLLMAGVVLSFAAMIPALRFCTLLSTAVILWALYRSLSKKTDSRRKEYFAYMRVKQKIKNEAGLQKRRWKERKVCCYFKCRKCKTVYRVPRGKGKIEVTCPKCKSKEIRYT